MRFPLTRLIDLLAAVLGTACVPARQVIDTRDMGDKSQCGQLCR